MHTATFRALAEPNRLHIVELLRSGPLPVGDVVDHLGSTQPHVSKHLRVLADSGIVTPQRHGRQRIYHLQPEPFAEMQEWVESFERTWEERLDRLGGFLQRGDESGSD